MNWIKSALEDEIAERTLLEFLSQPDFFVASLIKDCEGICRNYTHFNEFLRIVKLASFYDFIYHCWIGQAKIVNVDSVV